MSDPSVTVTVTDADAVPYRPLAAGVLGLAQLFNCFNARSETHSALAHLFTNRWLWGSIAGAVLLQVAVVHLPWLNVAFGTVPLIRPKPQPRPVRRWFSCAA